MVRIIHCRAKSGKAYVQAAAEHGRAVAEYELARLQFERASARTKCDVEIAAKSVEEQEQAQKLMKEKKAELKRAERALDEKKAASDKLDDSDSSSCESDC